MYPQLLSASAQLVAASLAWDMVAGRVLLGVLLGKQQQQQGKEQQDDTNQAGNQEQQQQEQQQAEAQEQGLGSDLQQQQAGEHVVDEQLEQAGFLEPGSSVTPVHLLLEQVLQHLAATGSSWLQQWQHQQQEAGALQEGGVTQHQQQLRRLQQMLDSVNCVLGGTELTPGVIACAADLLGVLRRSWHHLLRSDAHQSSAAAAATSGTPGQEVPASLGPQQAATAAATTGLGQGQKAAAEPQAAASGTAAADVEGTIAAGEGSRPLNSRALLALGVELDAVAAHLVDVLHGFWADGQPQQEDLELCLSSMQPVLLELFKISGSRSSSSSSSPDVVESSLADGITGVASGAVVAAARVQAIQVLQAAAVHAVSGVRLKAIEGVGKLVWLTEKQLQLFVRQAGQEVGLDAVGKALPQQHMDSHINPDQLLRSENHGSCFKSTEDEAVASPITELHHEQEQLRQLFLCLASLLLERCSDTSEGVAEAAAVALERALLGLSTYGPTTQGHSAAQQLYYQPRTSPDAKEAIGPELPAEAGSYSVHADALPHEVQIAAGRGEAPVAPVGQELYRAPWVDNHAWLEQTGVQPLQVVMKPVDLAVMFMLFFQVS